MSIHSDNRDSLRKLLRCQALLALPGGSAPMRARTVDVSLGGACVLLADPLKAGVVCAFRLEPLVKGRPVRITGNAKVAYSILSGADGFRVGLQFMQLDEENKKLLAELMEQ